MTAAPAAWAIELALPPAALAPFEEALAPLGFASSTFEGPDKRHWRLQVLCTAAPDRAAVAEIVAGVAASAGLAAPEIAIAPLPDIDWVAHTNRLLAPLRAGRFFLYGAHDAGRAPAGAWQLQIDAGLAFGTGRAPSTFGCLLAIDALARRKRLRRALDIGTGSGVLALAVGRASTARIVAADIDPVAVGVARRNAGINRLGRRVRLLRADGLRAPLIRAGAPYDLITANILAEPLARLARDLRASLAPGGVLVLSGLLAREERRVLAPYLAKGWRLQRRIAVEGWHTLVLQSGRGGTGFGR
jgi:ribosomal protein L11 methyltransferase